MSDVVGTPTLTAIVLTWNSRKYIEKCLDALEADVAGIPTELIVVDNGSLDGTPEVVAARPGRSSFVRLALVRLTRNRGTTWTRNLGLREARGKYLLVLDADTEILPGTVRALIAEMDGRPRVGIVGPRLVSPEGKTLPGCKRFPTLRTKIFKGLPGAVFQQRALEDELYPKAVYEAEAPQDVDYCISAAWLLNPAAVRDVGLLDERFFFAPEDVDYCLRMWEGGWRVRYHPGACVVHHTQRISYRSLRMMTLHLWGLGQYFKKHGYLWSREQLYRRLSRSSS